MRTDRTFVCTDCRIRCWPVRRCPACGETRALVDLERHPEKIVEPPTGTTGRADLAAGTGTAGVLGLVVAAAGAVEGMLAVAELGLMIGGPLLVAAFLLRPRNAAKLAAKQPDDALLRYRPLESPVVRSDKERVIEAGRVRAREILIAPLSQRPCVAWRLVGEGKHGRIDDARGTRFELVGEHGEPELDVDATIASLDLRGPAYEPGIIPPPDDELAAWLRARGADPRPEALTLRELILEEGARIEVIGSTRRETRADGYRGSITRDVLSDLPGSPLIVRPPVDPDEPAPRSIA